MANDPGQWGEELEGRITDLVIRLILIGFIVHWSLELVRPFAPVLIWAAIIAVAVAPVHDKVTAMMGGRPRLAATLVCFVMLALLIGPVVALVESFVETASGIAARANDGSIALPTPPPRLATIPLVGAPLSEAWSDIALNLDEALAEYRAVLAPVGLKAITVLSSVSLDLVTFMVAIVLTGFLLVNGTKLANGGRLLARRIVPPRGSHFVDLAGATVRGVSRGVFGVAILQSILIGVTFQIAGVPGAGLLAFLVLILAVIQIGPALIVLPVLVWIWFQFDTLPSVILTVALVVFTVIDSLLKPILMARGLTTPTILIFVGVIGGAFSHGLIGLFLGPIVLGVFYDFVVAWAMQRKAAIPADVALETKVGERSP